MSNNEMSESEFNDLLDKLFNPKDEVDTPEATERQDKAGLTFEGIRDNVANSMKKYGDIGLDFTGTHEVCIDQAFSILFMVAMNSASKEISIDDTTLKSLILTLMFKSSQVTQASTAIETIMAALKVIVCMPPGPQRDLMMAAIRNKLEEQ